MGDRVSLPEPFSRGKRLNDVAIYEKGILDRGNTLHDPLHPSIIKIHGQKNSLQETPINPIICLGYVNFQGPKALFPASFFA